MPVKTAQISTCTRDKCGVIICYNFLYSVPSLLTNGKKKKRREGDLSHKVRVWEFRSKASSSTRIRPGLLYGLKVMKFEWIFQGEKMLGFRPIFNEKKVQRHGGRLWNRGQWVKEKLLYYALFCCQSLSILLYFFSWSSLISKAACEQWQRAQQQLQLWVPTNSSLHRVHWTTHA